MVQILPRGKQSFGELLGAGLGQALKETSAERMRKQALAAEEAQKQRLLEHEYGLKGDIEKIKGNKPLNSLQEAQKRLTEAKESQIESQQSFFDKILNKNQQTQEEFSPQIQSTVENLPIDELQLLAGFAGQPGQQGIIGNIAKGALDRKFQEEKLKFQKEKISPEHLREQRVSTAQAESDVKYNQTLQEASKQHELKEQTLERLDKLNKKGVTGKPYEKLLEKAGLVALTSEGRREFAADVKNLITDIRSILGAQFTGFEFQTILNAYPSADFSMGANDAIIKNLKDFQDIKKKEVEFAEQLKKQNNGKIPEDFQAKVNEMVRTYASSKVPNIKENTRKIMNEEYGIAPGFTLMFDSQGEPLNVPDRDVIKLLEEGLAELP